MFNAAPIDIASMSYRSTLARLVLFLSHIASHWNHTSTFNFKTTLNNTSVHKRVSISSHVTWHRLSGRPQQHPTSLLKKTLPVINKFRFSGMLAASLPRLPFAKHQIWSSLSIEWCVERALRECVPHDDCYLLVDLFQLKQINFISIDSTVYEYKMRCGTINAALPRTISFHNWMIHRVFKNKKHQANGQVGHDITERRFIRIFRRTGGNHQMISIQFIYSFTSFMHCCCCWFSFFPSSALFGFAFVS